MHFADLIHELEIALAAPLPGAPAQNLMAPRPRRDWPAGGAPAPVRQAAGLLLLFPQDDRAHVVLTLRSPTLDRHGGQVSLPGGVLEPGETFEQAALREAQEEVGLAPGDVRILGPLTPIDIPVSRFRLHPIVGAAEEPPRLQPAHGEVAEILAIPLAHLLDPRRIVWRTLAREGRTLEFPAFPADRADVWGATAMVVAELLVTLGWPGPPER